jgi:predicted transporter
VISLLMQLSEFVGLSLTQIGLLLDGVGFLIVFLFGGFQYGVDSVVVGKAKLITLPAKIIGGSMVVLGFYFQYLGATPNP